jgi:hypothetical protein
MKRLVEITGVSILLIAALLYWYAWGSRQNRGLSFGYYGEFNTVSNALARLPGVSIVDSGYNADMTLEEIHFEINRDGRRLEIELGGRDPIRKMSGAALEKALSNLIEGGHRPVN